MFRSIKVLVLSVSLVGAAAFAGQYGIQSVSDISSMQLRADGQYNVVCKNGDFEVVSSADVANNNVCPFLATPPPPPPVLTANGTYRDSTNTGLCDQKSNFTYEAGVLKSIRLDFPGCGGDFMAAECINNVCESDVIGQHIIVTAVDQTHYTWLNGGTLTVFERIGDLSVKSVRRSTKSRSHEAGK